MLGTIKVTKGGGEEESLDLLPRLGGFFPRVAEEGIGYLSLPNLQAQSRKKAKSEYKGGNLT
jgi:hypothetical protein